MRKRPSEGGCWFCHEDSGPLDFSTEFDTNVHVDCIKSALAHDNPEAVIMAREFDLPEAQDKEVRYEVPDNAGSTEVPNQEVQRNGG